MKQLIEIINLSSTNLSRFYHTCLHKDTHAILASLPLFIELKKYTVSITLGLKSIITYQNYTFMEY